MTSTITENNEVDVKGYVSSSDFREDFPKYFGNKIPGGYRVEGGERMTAYLTNYEGKPGVMIVCDKDCWTVGYTHPRGYGKLYGIWFKPLAKADDAEKMIREIASLARTAIHTYEDHERKMFPEWDSLDSATKKMMRENMAKSGHVKRADSLLRTGIEYTRYISFWGQDMVKTKMTRNW